MNHCIAIASGKGGVGKSAITANLGAALSMLGRKVVLIDADIGLRSLDALLSLENNVVYDIIDLTSGDCELNNALLASEAYPNLYLLPAAQFRRAKALDPKQLRKILSLLRIFYDYILIDCPAGIERGLRNVLNAGVDDTILVTTPDDISLRSAERARTRLPYFGREGFSFEEACSSHTSVKPAAPSCASLPVWMAEPFLSLLTDRKRKPPGCSGSCQERRRR